MRHKSIALLLAFILLAGAAAPARGASQPSVLCETGEKDGIITLALEDLNGSAIYGVQVELVLAGEYARCSFIPDSRTAYSPDCLVERRQGSTTVTIYLTDRSALNKGSTLELGGLDLGTGQLIDWNILPETAQVILLDQRLRPMGGSMSGSLPVTATAPTGTPHDPAGTPHNPTGTPQDPADDSPEAQLPPTDTAALPFLDIAAGDWYYSAVGYVYARSIMSGTSANTFSPDQNTTRGMLVTMLHRLEGSPAALPAAFPDVPAGAYYAGPVAWASENSIVTGMGDGRFSPETPITRADLAALLYRFAQYKGLDTTARADLGLFPDAAMVPLYAAAPMSWAVGTGLMNGTDGRLDPAGQATRAQVAVIFQRLCVNLLGMV